MNPWYAQMVDAATDLITRFIDDEPANAVEETVFTAVREVLAKVKEAIDGLFARVEGTPT